MHKFPLIKLNSALISRKSRRILPIISINISVHIIPHIFEWVKINATRKPTTFFNLLPIKTVFYNASVLYLNISFWNTRCRPAKSSAKDSTLSPNTGIYSLGLYGVRKLEMFITEIYSPNYHGTLYFHLIKHNALSFA